MAQQAQTQPNGRAVTPDQKGVELSKALEAVLEATPAQRFKAIDTALQSRIDQIEELLPPQMKGQGARLAKRAVLTLNRKPKDYEDVTPQSFVRCVLEAAENGFAVDGKYAYAIIYNNKVSKKGEPDRWAKEAQMQLSYMALVAVARRLGILKDSYARLVRENDEFEISETNGKSCLTYRPALKSPGALIGAYAVAILPDGSCRWEWMDQEDIDKIRARSKSWQNRNGPWLTDDGEMRKKTVLRRLLKMYGDDPAMQRALDMDDGDYDETYIPEKKKSALSRFEASSETVKDDGEIVDSHSPRSEHETTVEADNPVDALVLRIRKATTENQLIEATNAANAGGFGDDDRDFMLSEIDKRSNQLKAPKK